jgi:hypothetical protein
MKQGTDSTLLRTPGELCGLAGSNVKDVVATVNAHPACPPSSADPNQHDDRAFQVDYNRVNSNYNRVNSNLMCCRPMLAELLGHPNSTEGIVSPSAVQTHLQSIDFTVSAGSIVRERVETRLGPEASPAVVQGQRSS